MASDAKKFVTVGDTDFEDVARLTVAELKEMVGEIDGAAAEAQELFDAAKARVQAELKARAEEALAALEETGYVQAKQPADKPGAKRGRKSAEEKAAIEAAKSVTAGSAPDVGLLEASGEA